MNHPLVRTILLIDKCAQERVKLTRYLQQDSLYTYQIVELTTAKEALNWCYQKTPDVILLNFAVSDEDGLVILEQLYSPTEEEKAAPLCNNQIAVILLIEPENKHLALQAMKSGVQDYLIKNQITPEILQHVVHHAIERMYLMQELAETKAALQESEERWQLAINSSNDGIWDWNVKTNQVFFSPRWKQMRGFADDEISYRIEEWISRIHLDDRDRIMTAVSDYFNHKTPLFQEEYRVQHKNGSYLWILDRGQALWDELGNVVRMSRLETDITKHKQTEEELRKSEHRYATLTQAAPVAIFRLDLAGNCIYVNDRWSEMTGKPIQAALGQGYLYSIHPEDRDRLLSMWYEVWGQRKTYRNEGRFLRADGSIIWFYLQVIPETDPNSNITGYVGTLTDISEQQAALRDRIEVEAQLRKISERLTLAIRSGGFGIWEYDCIQGKLIWDERMHELYGVHPDDFQGDFNAWFNLVHPDDQDRIWTIMEEALYNNQEYNTEFRIIQPSGKICFIKASGLLNRDEQGLPLWMIGINIDITERKQAEKELIRNRDLREAIFNESTDALFLVDPVTLLTLDCNRRAVELFEATDKAELIGIEGKMLQRRPFTSDEIDAIVAQINNQGFWSKEIEYVTRQGKVFWGNIAAKPITIAGRTLNLVRVTDINERKQAEEELWRTNEQLVNTNAELARATRLKDEFLANMSHELRTPLNAILGMSEGFLEGVFGSINQKQEKAIATIERSGKHLLELINDILDLSKIESGKLELQISNVSVRSLCDASLTFIKQMALKKNISLRTDISSHIGTIQVDDRRMRQVLINLLSNAVKFTPEGGSVNLQVWLEELGGDEGDEGVGEDEEIYYSALAEHSASANSTQHSPLSTPHLCFCVIDTGIGIHPEDMSKLFQPFTQLDSSLNRNYTGTGLGLALVKRIVSLHGGTVSVNSEVGKGSCFTVRIPYLVGNESLNRPIMVASPSYRLPAKNAPVLIIEDSVPAADQITRYLSEMEMQFVVYPRGEGAVEEALRLQPALIILDLQLPNLSGWDVLTQLKLNSHTQDIPVIITSVVDEPIKGLAQGAFAYLVKPINRSQLQATLDRLHPDNTSSLAMPVVAKPALKSPLILLAEDNQANVDTISGYLESRGYELIFAENGKQAIDVAKEKSPDLIIMDIQMPGMNGLEAIGSLRHDPQFVDVPILALTALAMTSDRDACLAAGANEYLTKPIKLKQLVLTIQQLLNLKSKNF
ncbi:two-component hybrid sensor and regulator [Nostoc sp. NIES-3756]|uniref:PAS domain-containing protein n=1 Tax=Nostoc sp. NIES-3756 TaxID=1751286 RepID=UPI0007205F8B|nr:PAS domain-containing protein [Nostoc sp. NIES-3756]BAT55932.1 two-component hybrid sensor and regulator [Nostoc sp. NIES-3756]